MIYNFITSAILCLILVHAGTSRLVVVDEANITLVSLCNNVSSNDVIQVNASTVILNVDCLFDNITNLTLMGPSVINCLHNGSLYFTNSFNINLTKLIIKNCGTANTALRQAKHLQLPNPLKEQIISVLLICCVNVTMTDVTMTDNLAINLVGINVLGISVLENVTIQNVVPLQERSNLISSAAVLEFRDIHTCNYSGQMLHHDNNSLHINNSYFLNNTNTLPGKVFNYFNSYTMSFDSHSNRSIPVVVPGLTVGFIRNDTSYSISVLVRNTMFRNNHGRFGGGLFVAFAIPVKNYSMKIDNCTFQGNTVNKKYIETSYGAAVIAMSLYYKYIHNNKSSLALHSQRHIQKLNFLIINNSSFTDNSAVIGTCIYLYLFVGGQSVTVTLENLSFSNNKGDVATAVYAEDHLLYENLSTVYVTMTNIRAEHNQLVHATNPELKPLSNVNGLFVFFNVQSVTLRGHLNDFTSNSPGVMGLSGTDIIFDGDFHFVNNSTPNDGGAVYLNAGSTMIIEDNSHIYFRSNVAGKMGGAVYSDSSTGLAVLAAICPLQFNITESKVCVNFSNNSASHGGNAIFATQLYPCGWFPKFGSLSYNENVRELYKKIFNFSSTVSETCGHSSDCSSIPSHDMSHSIIPRDPYIDYTGCFNLSDHDITSAAHSVCFCNATNICCTNHKVSVSPGKEATFHLMVVDSKKSPIYSGVRFLSNHVCNSTKIFVNPYCTEVTVSFCGSPNATVNVTLRPSIPLYTEGINLTVHFNDCSVGFHQEDDSCLCDLVLKHKGFCDDSNGLIIPPGAWMDIIGKSLYFHSYCDVTYCKYSSSVIHFSNNISVCRGYRDGILCGKCMEGFSVVFGSQDCHRCHNYALVTLVGYALVGVLVVFLLSFLKLTVDKGIINGVVFYANIVYINHNLFYIAEIKALPGVFNLISLDAPTSICFYQGMTALAKYTVEFIFPVYLWLLVLLVVLLIKRFPRVSQVIQSPSQLLATLVYLSYSKLLLLISYTLMPIEVSKIQSSEDSTNIRWYQDPNVTYLDPWHTVVVIVSLLLFFIFLLPFAVILTFPNYCLGFRCLIHFKPIIDSYTAPYKDKWAFWLGIHLLMLILFYIFLTIQQIHGSPKDLLLIILLFVIPLTGVQLYCKPYKSKWVNLLDTLFLCNLIMGGCVILWMVKDEGGLSVRKDYFQLVVYFSLAVAVLEILVIILYHVMMVTSSGQLLVMRMYQLLCCKKDVMALDTFSEHGYGHPPAKLSYSENQPLLDGIQDEPPRFRESFLEYDNLISSRSQS